MVSSTFPCVERDFELEEYAPNDYVRPSVSEIVFWVEAEHTEAHVSQCQIQARQGTDVLRDGSSWDYFPATPTA